MDTLNETITETLMRDINEIKAKILVVLNPKSQREDSLRDWDLWGPFIFCLFLSTIFSITAPKGQAAVLFTGVFSVICFGSIVVTLDLILLGSRISFFQSLCALGYCLFPVVIASLVSFIVNYLVVRVFVSILCCYWSITSITRFLSPSIPEEKKCLGLYPCFLMYFVLYWLLITHHK